MVGDRALLEVRQQRQLAALVAKVRVEQAVAPAAQQGVRGPQELPQQVEAEVEEAPVPVVMLLWAGLVRPVLSSIRRTAAAAAVVEVEERATPMLVEMVQWVASMEAAAAAAEMVFRLLVMVEMAPLA
jgi:hypothetical protein